MFDKFSAALKGWRAGESGATAIEYGLIAGAVGLGIVATIFLTGDALGNLFSAMAGAMSSGASVVAER